METAIPRSGSRLHLIVPPANRQNSCKTRNPLKTFSYLWKINGVRIPCRTKNQLTLKRICIQKSTIHYGQGNCVSAPTATNYYHGYNTNNTFPLTANPARNTDATEAMRQAEGEEGGGVNGQVISIANGTAAFGPVGGMLDVGGVIDSYGNSKMYLTVGWAIGFGATAGMGYSRTNSNMTVNDLSGWASGVSFSVPFTPVGIEGYMDMSHGAVRDHYGNNLEGFGGNIGKGQGWFTYFSYTFIFSPPLPEFWTRPGSRR